MSTATSYSRDTTDILDEQVDSSSILIHRLDSWRHAVSIVHNYAHQTLSTQNSITAGLSKQHKAVSDLPSFNGSSITHSSASASGPTSPTSPHSASALAGTNQAGAASATTGPATTGLGSAGGGAASSNIASAFQALARQTDYLWQESDQVAASIKSSIIPQLDALNSDLEKHHKTLRTQGHKLSKEVEKHRENTVKHLEHLGRTVSVSNSGQKIEPKNDPYVLHRKVRGVAAEQISKENQFSESNLNVQNNFGSLEQHIIEVLQNSIASLDELTQRYGKATLNASGSTERHFAAIKPSQEWAQFKQANSSALVPDSGFQRDPSRVTFANSDADATVPIIEGSLSRKGTILKGHKPGYYVLTPSGFLHEFKSADYLTDSHPELSLFIPDSEISGLPPATGAGEPSFKIVSRNSNNALSTRKKYEFSASSYDELAAWHTAIAKVAGATAVASTLDNVEEDPGVETIHDNTTAPGTAAVGMTDAPYNTATSGIQQPAYGSGATERAATGFTDPNTSGASTGFDSNYGDSGNTTGQGLGTTAGAAGLGGVAGGALGSGFGNEQHNPQTDIAAQQYQQPGGFSQQTSQYGSGDNGASAYRGEGGQLNSAPQGLQQQPSFSHEASQLGGGSQNLQSNLSGGPSEFTNRSQQQSYSDAGTSSGFGSRGLDNSNFGSSSGAGFGSGSSGTGYGQDTSGGDLAGSTGLGAAAGTVGGGALGFGSESRSTSGHAYNQLAGENQRQQQPQATSAYSTPQQQSQSQFNDQRFGDDTTPYTTTERVEGLRLGDSGPQQYSSSSFNQGKPLTTSEQIDSVPAQRSTSGHDNSVRNTAVYNNTGSDYQKAPQSPTSYSGYGSAPHSPVGKDSGDVYRSPTVGNTGFIGGAAPRSPTTGDTSNFQGSRSASGTSHKSGVPHYKLSPSKRGTLQSDSLDGSGAGGTFGAIPVSTTDERPAREAVREHESKVPDETDVHHHHHLHLHHHKQPEIQHKGHRHNPDEGLPGAHIQEKPREDIVASSSPSTPRYESAKPTSDAQAFTHSGYGSPRLGGEDKSGLGHVKPRDPGYSNPEPSAYPTIAAGNANPLVGSTTKYGATAAPTSSRSDDLNHVKSKDVQYSHPKPGQFSTIAEGSTNPLLGSETHYNAPAAPGGGSQSNRYTGASERPTQDVRYSRPDPSQVSDIAAGSTDPLVGSSTHYNAPGAPSGNQGSGVGSGSPRNVQYSRPDPSEVSGIAAGNTNPLVGSNTQYNAPGAPSGGGYASSGGDSSRNVQYSRPDPSQVSGIAAGNKNPLLDSNTQYNAPGSGGSNLESRATQQFAGGSTGGISDLGSKSQKEPFTIVNTQDVSRGSSGHARNASFEGINHDTGSRLDPLSSKYSAASGHGESRGAGVGSTGTGVAAGTVGGGALGYGAGSGSNEFQDARQSGNDTLGASGSGAYGGFGSGVKQTSGKESSGAGNAGATRVTGAGGSSYGTQGSQDAREKTSSGGYGDFPHHGHSQAGATAAGAGGAGALGAAGAGSSGQHHSGQQQGLTSQQGQGSSYGSTGQTHQQQPGYESSRGPQGQYGQYGQQAQHSQHSQHGHGSSSNAAAGGVGGAGAGAGAGAAGCSVGEGSGSQYRPYSSEQHGSQFGGNAGGYSQKDYSNIGPEAGGNADFLQGPGSGAGGAKNKSSSGGGKLASAAGGLGALGGLAGMAGVPGGGEIGQATGLAGSLGSGGVKNAVKNQIPGMGEYNQAKNVATGDFGSAAKQEVPGANQASQFSDAAKDVRGGGAANKAEGKAESAGTKEAEKAEKPSGLKKLANVFKS